MICSLPQETLYKYVMKQLEYNFPDGQLHAQAEIYPAFLQSLDRLEKCFLDVSLPNYHRDDAVFFNHLHSDQYSQFLYFLGNSLYQMGGDQILCSKTMLLNRILSGMFVSYKCELPERFLFCHAVGSVVGNAVYSDYLVIFQNVTINTSLGKQDSVPPSIGRGVFLGAGAQIIGDKRIGNYVSVGAGTSLYNVEVPDKSTVIRKDGSLCILPLDGKPCKAQDFWNIVI